MEKNKKICFVTINSPPDFLGGYVLYHKNLIEYLKKRDKNLEINWVYFGKENKSYKKDGINYFELNGEGAISSFTFGRSFKLYRFFTKNYFDIINSIGGLWTYLYKKKKGQKIIQTSHGAIYYFNRNHLRRFGFFKKILFFPLLPLSWILERPHKETDKIICVSDKVKLQVERLYGRRKNIYVVRTGVDLKVFKPGNKNEKRKKLKLENKKIYGLYVGGGGYWTKGLDRAVNLGKEIYKLDKTFRLLLIGPDYKKVRHLINKPFTIFLKNVSREKMPLYYSASDIFLNMSRYEGGAPTLVTSEAMASGCLIVCSKDCSFFLDLSIIPCSTNPVWNSFNPSNISLLNPHNAILFLPLSQNLL